MASIPNNTSTLLKWMRQVSVLLGAFTLVYCASPPVPEVKTAFAVEERCSNNHPERDVLRAEHLGASDEFYLRIRPEISSYLDSVRAMPLWCDGVLGEAYRLVWLPSYRPAVVIEIAKIDGDWRSRAWIFGDPRAGGGEAAQREIVGTSDRPLSVDQGGTWLQLTVGARFWTIPAWRRNPGLSDGIVWVLEGRRDRAYRVVGRYTPLDEWEPGTRDLLSSMFKLAAVDVPEQLREP